jgi:hypothetical protein
MFNRIAPFFQFLPISFFSSYAFWQGQPNNERWLEAFMLAAAVGIVQFVALLLMKKPMSRLVMATNLFLIFGGVAVYFQQWWFLELYAQGQEHSIFVFIIMIGVITTLFSTAGFIGVICEDKRQLKHKSYTLLLASVIVFFISFISSGDIFYSAVLPIVTLALLQRYLAFLLNKSVTPPKVMITT